MILLSVRATKLLLFVVSTAMILKRFHKQLSKRGAACLGALMILLALTANFAAGKVPALTDTVTLTALGEKQKEAGAEEILLTGYMVDGENFSAGKALQVMDGKWFWSGESYLWRIETDPRQPAGTTRTVAIKVPVGWERSLEFCSDMWRGKVEITANGTKQIVDTFSEEYTPLSVPIGRSQTTALVLNQVRRLAVYAVLFCAGAIAVAAWLCFAQRKPEAAAVWLRHNNGKVLYALIAIVAGFLMFRHSGDVSFWADELLQIECAMGSLEHAVQNCLKMIDATPPLYTICAYMWYHIAPFGEQGLLLLSVIPTAAAAYVIGLAGEKLGGKYCGTLSASLLAFSSTAWNYAAFEFRSYSFVLFFSALSLYGRVQRDHSQKKRSCMAAYSISLLGLAMSHYFGMLLCGLYFLTDLYLYGTGRITKRAAVSYILPGSASLVWLCLVYQTTLRYQTAEMIASWYSRPTPQHIVWLLKFLSGNYLLSFYLFLFGVACAFVGAWQKRNAGKDWRTTYQRILLWTIFAVVALIYIYGNYINQKSTMWADRYFIILIPFVILLSALSMTMLFPREGADGKLRLEAVTLLIGMILAGHCLLTGASTGMIQPFRESADWLYMQSNDIFNSDTVIMQTCIPNPWQEYYICRQSRRDPLNVVGQDVLSEEELIFYNKVYVQYSHIPISESLQTTLDENYVLEAELPDIQIREYIRK